MFLKYSVRLKLSGVLPNSWDLLVQGTGYGTSSASGAVGVGLVRMLIGVAYTLFVISAIYI